MKHLNLKKISVLLFAIMSLSGCNKEVDFEGKLENLSQLDAYGGIAFPSITKEEFLKEFKYGDLIDVKFQDTVLSLPLFPNHTYLEDGEQGVMLEEDSRNILMLASNNKFASEVGIASQDDQHKWNALVSLPLTFTFSLKEKGGFSQQYEIRRLDRSNVRSDYLGLSDDEFANCRVISTTGLKENVLYRGSSPFDPKYNRDTYARNYLENNSINNVIDLSDTEEEATSLSGYTGYLLDENVEIAYFGLGTYFFSSSFKAGFKRVIEHVISKQGKFYFHCLEGKDRSGFICAVLEAFAGASKEEILDDYGLSYINFFKLTKGSEKYNYHVNKIEKMLNQAFNGEEDLAKGAYNYLLSIGLSEGEISTLSTLIKK